MVVILELEYVEYCLVRSGFFKLCKAVLAALCEICLDSLRGHLGHIVVARVGQQLCRLLIGRGLEHTVGSVGVEELRLLGADHRGQAEVRFFFC